MDYPKLRDILEEKLEEYNGEPILLPIDSNILKNIIFNCNVVYDNGVYSEFYKFGLAKHILKKIDFSNISFDNVLISYKNFDGFKNVKINPQTVYNKTLYASNFKDVEFIGPFNETSIVGSNFEGSKNAVINPQTLSDRSLKDTNLKDVIITGSFDNIDMTNCKYEGSKIELEKSEISIEEFENVLNKKIGKIKSI